MRPPVLSGAVEAARKIVGEAKALAMVTEIPQAILQNRGPAGLGRAGESAEAKNVDRSACPCRKQNIL